MATNRFHQKWYNQLITFPIITGVIGSVAYDGLKNKPILSSLTSIVISIWNFIVFVLTFKVAIFWIIIALLLISILLCVLNYANKVNDPNSQYTTDIFIKWKWEWRYSGIYICDLIPLCPSCNTIMNYRNENYDKFAECPRCDNVYTTRELQRRNTDIIEFEDDKKIEMLIVDNVKKANYNKSLK